jgi:hypothetical protein
VRRLTPMVFVAGPELVLLESFALQPGVRARTAAKRATREVDVSDMRGR